MNLLEMDATLVAEAIRQGKLTAQEATETYIERIEAVNPTINAVVEKRYEEARAEAKEADLQLQAGKADGRLFGVPISMKESFDVAGMRTTGGLLHQKDRIIQEDAEIVTLLKREGAIILGKTNTPALCFCQETENKLYGRTNNPWNIACTAGGSSGGEGALIAAGGAAVGIGSDIGGSIRFPAHFNGVIGFKSGNGQVSQHGSYPYNEIPIQERMLGMGAMAKSVRDARTINEIIAHQVPSSQNLQEFTIAMPLHQLHYPITAGTQKALFTVRDAVETDFPLVDETPPYYHESALLWQLAMSIDGARSVATIAFGEKPQRPVRTWLRERLRGNTDLHRYLSWAMVGASLFAPKPSKVERIQATILERDQEVQAYLAKRLLILPVYHTPALRHGQVYKEIFSVRRTFRQFMPFVAYGNTWGLPSLTIPVASEFGMPIGLQILSAVGNEDAIFQLGEWLEPQVRGWKLAEVEMSKPS
ncbi:amidase [Rubeoparvulum massiliense]|uniref:amidase n=1 Tax=Rubeoparvulum massiliense TaxID=1631346 RepID=UPI000AF21386|nr:amidase [Rubeoparvulum massiliense]